MSDVAVVPLTPELRGRLAELWVPWLKGMTGKDPEPEDLQAVADPESFYIASGGAVFFGMTHGDPVAVVAVKYLSGGVYEFCKLVVLEGSRGRGLGRKLVEACISFAQEHGGRVLMLQSFRRLDVALAMYGRLGFVPMAPPAQMLVLARTEVVMGMPLGPANEHRRSP
jgi:GNAT superfamily N-acetyltransferase